jgi:hypothetical protein
MIERISHAISATSVTITVRRGDWEVATIELDTDEVSVINVLDIQDAPAGVPLAGPRVNRVIGTEFCVHTKSKYTVRQGRVDERA